MVKHIKFRKMLVSFILNKIDDIYKNDKLIIFKKIWLNFDHKNNKIYESNDGVGIDMKLLNTELLISIVELLDDALKKTAF